MFNLEMKTSLLLVALSFLLGFLIMLFIRYKYRAYKKEVINFIVFYFLVSFGMSLILFRENLSSFISIIVANTILFAARLFLLRGTSMFFKKGIPKIPLFIFIVLYISCFLYFTYIYLSVNARIIVYAISVGIIHSIVTYVLIKSYLNKPRNQLLIIPFNILYIIYYVLRIAILLISKESSTNFLSYNVDSFAVFIDGVLGLLLVVGIYDILSTEFSEEIIYSTESKNRLHENIPGFAYRCLFDDYWTMQSVSSAFESITGYLEEEVIGNRVISFKDMIVEDYRQEVRNVFIKGREQRKSVIVEYEITKKNGERIWVWEHAMIIRDEKDHIVGIEGFLMDINSRKRAEDNLQYLSYHDQLTGLYNRRFFEQELLRLDTETNYPLTLIMADVNGLKLINDSLGHNFGDELLTKAAAILSNVCRSDDILARLGGDEFVLVLPKTDSIRASRVVNRLEKTFFKEKLSSLDVSLSFGYDTKTSSMQNIQKILINAENYMYKHKVYESSSMHSKTIEIIMNALYEKSNRELLHSKRVSSYCEALANALQMERDEVNQIKTAGLLHDIGKIGIDESILNKQGKLDDSEWEEIKKHPDSSWRILVASDEFTNLANCVLEHHERWDGKGYPKGLKKEEISIEARIIAIADSYDAMTSERTYKKAMSKESAIQEIKANAGKQFDPAIVEVFINSVLQATHN